MTSITAQLAGSLNVNMPDDEMEIGSPFGQDLGDDDDIDIDIDFENHDHDEDHMIADYVAEIPDTEHPDDAMMDDETASQEMEDVDGEIEELPEHEMSAPTPEREVENFETTNAPMQDFDDALNKDSEVDPGIDWDEQPELTEMPNENPDTTEPLDVVATADEASVDHAKADRGASDLSPSVGSNEKNTVDTIDSVLATDHDDYDGNGSTDIGETASKPETRPTGVTAAPDTNHKDPELESTITYIDPSHVVVIYQDTEYALIAASESDDPNSYFFKDSEATTLSLRTFFEIIRNVLLDDLGLDDEICLSAGELGIEISESTASAIEMSFADIVGIYRSLLQNDGVTPGTLTVSISLKTDYCRRLTSLRLGAAEGKGLSELVTWADASESFDESLNQTSEHEAHPEEADETSRDETAAEGVVVMEEKERVECTVGHEHDDVPQDPLATEEAQIAGTSAQQPNAEVGPVDSFNIPSVPITNHSEEARSAEITTSVGHVPSGNPEQDHGSALNEAQQARESNEQDAADIADLEESLSHPHDIVNSFPEGLSELRDERQHGLFQDPEPRTESDNHVASTNNVPVVEMQPDNLASTSPYKADVASALNAHIEQNHDVVNATKVERDGSPIFDFVDESVDVEDDEESFEDNTKITPKSNESEGTLFDEEVDQASGDQPTEDAEFGVEDDEDTHDTSVLKDEDLSQRSSVQQGDNAGKRVRDSTEPPDSNEKGSKRTRT